MKRQIIFGVVGFLTVTSILFCSNYGVYFFTVLARYAGITQMVLNLLLLLVVLWIYGRERFQRDVNFMTSRIYPTWMVNIVRFVAPLFLLFGLLIAVFISMEFNHSPTSLFALGTIIFLFSWFLIPGYCIFKIKQTTGGIGNRLRRCIRPTDWYPADPVYKQRYEENFNSGDISHQLTNATLE
ncbi:sodium-dependent dopamine transporter-like [Episyrphus balteatus]|uniref:sodium-dependent dopamine transporter-like n=1 Tax=Episyrphus balteatus TaxID=286459 RepID=UPI00248556C5|nr:sodium-dependent dopamine transporter-like [Episyrphus balteatus]